MSEPVEDEDDLLTPAESAEVERLRDREALAERVQKDGAAILLRLGRIAKGKGDPRVMVAAAKEYRVWADGLLGRKPAGE